MDQRLVAWGRAVKARRRHRWPPLWLFTDQRRLQAVEAAVARLPAGLCGVVFRSDAEPDRAALLQRVARICRARRLALVVAGPARGAPAGAGRHLRRGFGPPGRGLVTASAHGAAELVRARRAGAAIVFLSPAFATRSHPGARALGPIRWSALARRTGLAVFALGGVAGTTARRLPRWAAGAGAIGALMP